MKKISTLLFAIFAIFTLNAETVLYSWDFNDITGTGGNDGKWSGNIASGPLASYSEWTLTNAYKGDKCIKLGAGSKQGSAQTPALAELSGTAILTFKAAAWDATNEQTDLLLEITDGGTLDASSVTLVKGAFSDYTVIISDGTPLTKITFKGKATSNSRFFLDDVVISTDEVGITTEKEASKSLTAISKNGILSVTTDGSAKTIEVFNILGQRIATKVVNSTTVDIAVQAGQVVIVKAGKDVKKVVTK